MSEAFDPENVSRLYLNNAGPFGSDTGKVECVRASDYDKLLALYREHVPAVPCYICGGEAKGTKAKVTGTGEAVCMACYERGGP